MTRTKKPEIHYHRQGLVERPYIKGKGYRMCYGYARVTGSGLVEYPWMTKTECRADAKKNNGKAVFYSQGKRES